MVKKNEREVRRPEDWFPPVRPAPTVGGPVPDTRTINTTAPLTGGGDLSADRTLAITAATGAAAGSMSAADKTKLDAISGTNTGDQTSIVGISGTKAEFNAELSDGDFLFVGDITQYTDEMARDAIGAALVAGTNITLTVNDVGDTITIDAAGGGGGGSWTLIQEVEAVGGETSLAVSSIPATYNDLIIIANVHCNAELLIRLNDDTAANYNAARHHGGSSSGGHLLTAATSMNWIGGPVGTANRFASVEASIFEYARTDRFKNFHGRSSQYTGGTFIFDWAGWWANTAAVNKVSLFIASSSFTAGSVLRVYGRS